MTARTFRLAVVTSHPIQYQAPWFRVLAAHDQVELEVFFCSEHGQKASYDPGFGKTFAWEEPLTEGYGHTFVDSVHPEPHPNHFWSLTNPALWSHLRQNRFDAVLLVGWQFASSWLALGAARAHGLKVLLRAESHLGSHFPRPSWKKAARRAGLELFFRNVDAFLAIGSRNAELYRAYGIDDDQIFMAPYAVDNDFFLSKAQGLDGRRGELRRALGVEDDKLPIVLSCGKLTERKAPLDLLNAFAAVRPERPSKLVFLGDGPQRDDVERRARELGVGDDVSVTGFMQQSELPQIYAAADLFVFPTQFETWGLVVNEAMLFGLPVICTDEVPSHDDLITAGETGDVYPVGDVARLSSLLRTYLENVESLHGMGETARARVKDWNFDRCVDATVQALDAVV
jgi:glycosyltransferase involved in cell wall biosynthesis